MEAPGKFSTAQPLRRVHDDGEEKGCQVNRWPGTDEEMEGPGKFSTAQPLRGAHDDDDDDDDEMKAPGSSLRLSR
jgi:hypothetical protein